ncbi:hypothetical protein [Desulfovibrio piger]|uniref:hypothetical protein n=1 Tax=Desulfovibrio piger TaxID=901 RepID=UPI0030776237
MPSTASKLDIFNMALGFIGTRTIASANENTPEAIQCGLYWDRARRAALEDYPYSFAQRRVKLAQKALPAVYEGEWHYCYGLPNMCLKVREVHDGRERGRKIPYRLQHEGQEVVILTNVADAMAEVTEDVTDTSLWDEQFSMMVARKLAALVAVPLLKNSSGKVQELEQLYQLAVPRSEGQDASEGGDRPQLDGWIAARRCW